MKIEVTAGHIAKGQFKNCRKCPIALALTDAGFIHSVVGRKYAILNDYTEVKLPTVAQLFISDFDAQYTVYPFSFDIDYEMPKV